MSPQSPPRSARLAGLRQLLDYLDANIPLPVPTSITIDVHAQSDLDGFEQVAHAAARLDATVATTPNGTRRAARQFGPVTYAVMYHPAVTR